LPLFFFSFVQLYIDGSVIEASFGMMCLVASLFCFSFYISAGRVKGKGKHPYERGPRDCPSPRPASIASGLGCNRRWLAGKLRRAVFLTVWLEEITKRDILVSSHPRSSTSVTATSIGSHPMRPSKSTSATERPCATFMHEVTHAEGKKEWTAT
jgi:hypothetical protein